MSINKIKDNYNNRRAFTTRPDRAIEMSGFEPAHTKNGSSIQMAAGGTSTDFGDLTNNRTLAGGMSASSTTRALFYGGEVPGANSNEVDSMELASAGNASDFGDLAVARGYSASTSNGTRALSAGGNSVINNIDFASIAQMGNFTDFGDLSQSRNAVVGICSPVRGVFAGGTDGTSPSPAYQNTIDYITINSTGNATDFGDLSGKSGYMSATNDSSGKAFFIGGAYGGDSTKNYEATDVITIATTGNAQEFGELTQMTRLAASACQGTTGLTMGGANPSYNNVIQRFVMPSLGNMSDFGDLNVSKGDNKGGCGSHDGIDWGSVAVQRPSVTYMPGSGRALYLGGTAAPSGSKTIDMFNINTLGNASDFGDVITTRTQQTSCSNLTRALMVAGEISAPSASDNVEAIQIASQGNTNDFGNLNTAVRLGTALANSTRAVMCGGRTPADAGSNEIQYKDLSTAGDFTDFGDLSVGRRGSGTGSSSTRGLIGAGLDPAVSNVIDYITIGSTGNATDFGDLTSARGYVAALSSAVRAVWGGGQDPSYINVMDYVTIASTGNGTDFGDLLDNSGYMGASSNSTRGVFAGGLTSGSPSGYNVIQYMTIATTGDTVDFGDLVNNKTYTGLTSDSHGGLQSA